MVRKEHEYFISRTHPKIQEFYNKNPNIDYVPSSEAQVHAQFDGKNVDGENTKRHIKNITRVRKGNFKNDSEYIYFYEEWKGHDHRNNEIAKYVVNGRNEIPIGQYQFDEFTGTTVCVGISRFETLYDIPYKVEILDKAVENEEIDESTTYYVQIAGGRVYGGYAYEDYRNLSFDDLVHIGKTGTKPSEKEIEVKTKRTGSKE